jgi:hypothetical protein
MITKKEQRYVQREYTDEKVEVVYVSHKKYPEDDDFLEIDSENMKAIMYHLKENLRLIDEVLLEYGMTVTDLRRFNSHE